MTTRYDYTLYMCISQMDLVNDSTLTHTCITEKVGERKTNKETDRLKDR